MKFISNIKDFAAVAFTAVVGFFGRFSLPALTAPNAAIAVGAVALGYAAYKYKGAVSAKVQRAPWAKPKAGTPQPRTPKAETSATGASE